VTPQCLAELYNFKNFNASQGDDAFIGVSGFLEQYARYDDWSQFANTFAPDLADTKFCFASVNGGRNDQNSSLSSVEANLDVQYTTGLVPASIHVKFYSTPGRGELVPDLDQPTMDDNQNEPYLDLFTYMLGLDDADLPSVFTTSYGESEQSVPAEYARKVCDMIGQLGTRGVSVIFCK
jgi:tripeptidyl-peptidase-1